MYYLIKVRSVRESNTQGELMVNEKEIIEFAKSIGVDLVRFTDAQLLNGIEENFLQRKKNNQISELGPNRLADKINPNNILESCKSIVVIGVQYPLTQYKTINNFGHMSSAGIGTDYHQILWSYLEKIVDYINKNTEESIEYKICVDTCSLSDREIAYQSGIGYYGKNNFIINEAFGSAINIGYILINQYFKKNSTTIEEKCGTCDICMKACPGEAIESDDFEVNQCISQLTQRKGELSYRERELIGKNIYGCDICQRVCPKNKFIENYTTEASTIDLFKLIQLSNKAFKSKYKNRGFSWRGNAVIKRNAIIALGNEELKENYDKLLFLLKHPSMSIQKCTLWALYHSNKKRFLDINLLNKELAIEKKKILAYYKKS